MNMIKDSFIPHQFDRLEPRVMQERARHFFLQMDRRRTVREFSSEPIPAGVLEDVVRTAGTAPSGAHIQPWFFCVVTNPKTKKQLRLAAEKEENQNYHHRFNEEWLANLEPLGTDEHKEYLEIAPAVIIVFRENYRLNDSGRKKNYYVQESVGIASGMLISAIHNAGLVTLTHTPNPMGFLNDLLDRPKNESAILVMPVGYPKEGTRIPNLARKPLNEIMAIL